MSTLRRARLDLTFALVAAACAWLIVAGCDLLSPRVASEVSADRTERREAAAPTKIDAGDNSNVFVLNVQTLGDVAPWGMFGLASLGWVNSGWKARRLRQASKRVVHGIRRNQCETCERVIEGSAEDSIERWLNRIVLEVKREEKRKGL